MYSRKSKNAPHAPRSVSKSGYRSKQKAQAAVNKEFKTRSVAKCNRTARRSRAEYYRETRAKR